MSQFTLKDDNGLIATSSRENICKILHNWFDGEEELIKELSFVLAADLYYEDEIGNAMHSIRKFKNSNLSHFEILGFTISKDK